MKKLFVIILLFISVFSFADDNTILLEKGNKAYNDKFYQEAINNYLNVIKNGLESPSLYYNLGNAYFKKEEYAAAILYFEKAKKLNPNDEDILYNLNVGHATPRAIIPFGVKAQVDVNEQVIRFLNELK